MNKLPQRFFAALILVLAVGLPANLFGALEDTAIATIHASVVHVDRDNRELLVIELEGLYEEEPIETQSWYYRTYSVDKKVAAFDYVRRGDRVTLQVEESLAIDVREPTEEEKENPFTTQTVTTKKGILEYDIVGVCEIVEIDRKLNKVTMQGPKGRKFRVRVGAPSMDRIKRVGDHLVVTYRQAKVVGLTRAD